MVFLCFAQDKKYPASRSRTNLSEINLNASPKGEYWMIRVIHAICAYGNNVYGYRDQAAM